jgi:hypothetical protein
MPAEAEPEVRRSAAELRPTAEVSRIEKARRPRICSEVALLMEAVDGITAGLVERGFWPNRGEYSAQPAGRYVTASDIMVCAKTVAWKAGVREVRESA